MNRTRVVPEDRIKTLLAGDYVPKAVIETIGDVEIRRLVCRRMGAEIAEKLFEFNKYKVVDEGDQVLYTSSIEVIVPK